VPLGGDLRRGALEVAPRRDPHAQAEMPDVDDFEHRLLAIAGRRLPPLPATVVIHQLGAFDPDRAIPLAAALQPVRVDARVHVVLHLQHHARLQGQGVSHRRAARLTPP